MTISNFTFAPNAITVRTAQQLTLNVANQDAAPHTLTFMGGGGSTGGPVFKEVMSFALQSLRIPPTGTKAPRLRIERN